MGRGDLNQLVIFPLIPAPSTPLRAGFFLKGEGTPTCVNTYELRGKLLYPYGLI